MLKIRQILFCVALSHCLLSPPLLAKDSQSKASEWSTSQTHSMKDEFSGETIHVVEFSHMPLTNVPLRGGKLIYACTKSRPNGEWTLKISKGVDLSSADAEIRYGEGKIASLIFGKVNPSDTSYVAIEGVTGADGTILRLHEHIEFQKAARVRIRIQTLQGTYIYDFSEEGLPPRIPFKFTAEQCKK